MHRFLQLFGLEVNIVSLGRRIGGAGGRRIGGAGEKDRRGRGEG